MKIVNIVKIVEFVIFKDVVEIFIVIFEASKIMYNNNILNIILITIQINNLSFLNSNIDEKISKFMTFIYDIINQRILYYTNRVK